MGTVNVRLADLQSSERFLGEDSRDHFHRHHIARGQMHRFVHIAKPALAQQLPELVVLHMGQHTQRGGRTEMRSLNM